MNLIQNIIEPDRLLLAWQAPERSQQERTRRVVGELKKEGDGVVLRYLFETDDYEQAKKSGFKPFPAFRNEKIEHRDGVLEAFMMRLPPRTRKDFDDFLKSIRVNPDVDISDFALLGYSEAKLPSDNFSLVHPFDLAPIPCELLTEIAGYRYYGGMNIEVGIGKKVTLAPEPENPVDPNAIQILYGATKIGYINRIQLPAFHLWLRTSFIDAYIEKINGTPERPRVFLFVSCAPK